MFKKWTNHEMKRIVCEFHVLYVSISCIDRQVFVCSCNFEPSKQTNDLQTLISKFMKTAFFTLASLFFGSFAANAIVPDNTDNMNRNSNSCLSIDMRDDPGCYSVIDVTFQNGRLIFPAESDVRILNSNGSTVFYSASLKLLDCSGFAQGDYYVSVNGLDYFKISI